MIRALEVILCIFVSVFLIGIFAIGFQVIGDDSPNKATIVSGILSFLGGLVGALGVVITTGLLIKSQKDSTLKQVNDTDSRTRQQIYLQYQLKKLDEKIEILLGVDFSLKKFQSRAARLTQLKEIFLGQKEVDKQAISWIEEALSNMVETSIETRNRLLMVLSAFVDEEILKESEYIEIVEKQISELYSYADSEGMKYSILIKKIEDTNTDIAKAYLKLFRATTNEKEMVLNKFVNI